MLIGLTLSDGAGQFTTNGTANDLKYFFSDSDNYGICLYTDETTGATYLVAKEYDVYNCTTEKGYFKLADALAEAKSGDEIELRAEENAENVVLPLGVDLFVNNGFTGTVTANGAGQELHDDVMFGTFTHHYYIVEVPVAGGGLTVGAIIGISAGSLVALLLIVYLCGYFFLYRKGKLDEKAIRVIYKFLPKNDKNVATEN
ncbi:MAG: hypothetical protein MJ072_05115, partial [Clostridia bacterium]|nr:hypothetical protein [Clostridia bacterium]